MDAAPPMPAVRTPSSRPPPQNRTPPASVGRPELSRAKARAPGPTDESALQLELLGRAGDLPGAREALNDLEKAMITVDTMVERILQL